MFFSSKENILLVFNSQFRFQLLSEDFHLSIHLNRYIHKYTHSSNGMKSSLISSLYLSIFVLSLR